MTTERLTDEELAELDSMSEAAEGCDCGCASSRAAFGCADAIPVLLAEVRELRAERRDLAAWMMRVGQRWPDHACGECVPNGPLVDPRFQCAWHRACAIERGEHER